MNMEHKEEVWVRDRNLGGHHLYVLFKVLRLDKIIKEVGVDGEEKRMKN